MKQLLTLLFLFIGSLSLAQPPAIPLVPPRMEFAGMSIQLDESARQLIQQDINALYSNRQYWNAKLDRVVLYFPIIEAILTQENVPTDFKFLAVQESSLMPDATSTSQAVGFWQFKRETALMNGMRVDDQIDERKSITGSTRGAATYLKKSNTRFNNWISSLYSFYLGAGGISKLIPAEWANAKEISLNGTTDRYILRFLAHKIAVENALPSYQTTIRPGGQMVALIEYPNGGGKTVSQIVTDLGASGVQVNTDDLLTYNRWILGESVPSDKQYTVMIPVPSGQINDVRGRIVSVSDKKTPGSVQNDVGFPVLKKVTLGVRSQADPILYEINGLPGIQAQSGDKGGTLARKARISYSSFLRYNDMSENDPIVAGEVYYLAKKRKKALVPFHTTREGETSRTISNRYGIRLKKLLRYNRLDRVQKLQVGRVMWLRERRPRNRAVEIINVPTPPVYDPTPATPSTRPDVAGNTNNGAVTVPSRPANSDNIPRNPSERRVYTPKFGGEDVPKTTTTPDRTPSERSAPAPVATTGMPDRRTPDRPAPATERTRPASQPATTATDGTTRPRPQAGTPDRPSATGTTRTVTVKPINPISEPEADNDVLPSVPTKTAEKGGFEVTTGNEPASTPSTTSSAGRNRQPATAPPVSAGQRSEPVASAPKPSTPVQTERSTVPVTNAPPSVLTTTRSLPTPSAGGRTMTMTHVVEAGQTYYSISKMYGVLVDDILGANSLTLEDKLSVGQKLTVRNVPQGFPLGREAGVSAPAAPVAPVSTPREAVVYHVVEKGQTMYRISKIYNVTIEQLQQWNGLSDVSVRIGQKIKIIK